MLALTSLRSGDEVVGVMERIELGGTGLPVSRMALGTWQFGGAWGDVDDAQSVDVVLRALDAGINVFDTAHAYGFGRAEAVLGRAIRASATVEREDVVLITKGGVVSGRDHNVRNASPDSLSAGLETSLSCLGTDYVDVYLLHWPDTDVDLSDVATTLQSFLDDGRVRYLGLSNHTVEQVKAMARLVPISLLQPPYSLLRREIERDLLPFAREHGLGVVTYGALAHGLLADRYSPEHTFPPGDWRSRSPIFQGNSLAKNLQVARRLTAMARERGGTAAQLALAWAMAQPGVDAVIAGCRVPEDLEAILPAGGLALTARELDEIEQIASSGVPIGGPSPEGGVDPDVGDAVQGGRP